MRKVSEQITGKLGPDSISVWRSGEPRGFVHLWDWFEPKYQLHCMAKHLTFSKLHRWAQVLHLEHRCYNTWIFIVMKWNNEDLQPRSPSRQSCNFCAVQHRKCLHKGRQTMACAPHQSRCPPVLTKCGRTYKYFIGTPIGWGNVYRIFQMPKSRDEELLQHRAILRYFKLVRQTETGDFCQTSANYLLAIVASFNTQVRHLPFNGGTALRSWTSGSCCVKNQDATGNEDAQVQSHPKAGKVPYRHTHPFSKYW